MALTGTNRGTGASDSTTTPNTTTTYVFSPASNCTAGALVVLCVSADNSASDGSSNNINSVTDSLGNTWTKRNSLIYDPDAANAGIQGATFETYQTAGTLTTGATITVTFGATTTAKSHTLQEFTGSVGTPVYKGLEDGTGGATASPSRTTGTILNGQAVLCFLAMEAGTTQSCTADADTSNGSWSTQQYSEVGSTTSGNCIASQFKVVTATATQTYNPTLGLSCDNVIGVLIIGEDITVTPAPVGGAGTWPTGRTLALDFSDTGTLTLSGALISQVDDQSGNNYDFTQTGDSRPTSEVDGVLGQAATFTADGSTDDWMEATATVANLTNASEWTIVTRIRVASIASGLSSTYGDGVLFPYGVSGPGIHLRSDGAGDDRAYAINEDGGWPPDECYVAIDLDTELILVAKLESGTLSIQIGNGTPATVSSGNVSATTETWRLGYAPGGGAWFDGAMSHALAWDRALSSGEISTTVAILGGTAGPALTAYAPTVRLDKIVAPGPAAITTTRYAPTVTGSGGGVAVTPPTAALSLTGYAPTIALAVIPATASLALASFAPTVLAPRVVVPSVGALTAATLAPTVVASANVSVTPATASLDLASFAPTVLAPRIVVPTTASLALASFAPSALAPRVAVPSTATLALTGYAPTIGGAATAVPATATLTTASYNPTVLAPRVVVPAPVALSLDGFAPTITAAAGALAVPSPAALTLTEYAPTVTSSGSRAYTPTTLAVAITSYLPIVTTAEPPPMRMRAMRDRNLLPMPGRLWRLLIRKD